MESMVNIDKQFWENKRVLITGNTGFKGSWLTIWLELLGARIMGFALPPPVLTNSLFGLCNLSKDICWHNGDIRNREELDKAIKEFKPEIIFHLAAQPLVSISYEDPVSTYEVNVLGTVNLLDVVRHYPYIRSVINVTTDKCYENREWDWGYRENEPMGGYDPYSNSKACSELVTNAFRQSYFNIASYGKFHNTAVATVRAGNVIGGGDYARDRLIPDILRSIYSQNKVKIRSPNAIRPWQHVLEPLSGYILIARLLYTEGSKYAEGWNFGPYDSDAKSVEWIVSTLCQLIPGSKGYELDEVSHPHEAMYLKLDISKARNRLGWAPRWNISTALRKIVEWEDADCISKKQCCQRQINEYGA